MHGYTHISMRMCIHMYVFTLLSVFSVPRIPKNLSYMYSFPILITMVLPWQHLI